VSHPSPYHWITHGIFSIHLTKLTMNVSRFHVSCTSHAAGFSIFFKILNRGWCINVIRLSANCIRAFQKDQQTLHVCAP
jgi:hypothetical protein